MRAIRDRVCCWLPDLRDVFQEKGVPLDLVYEEGDAEALMSGVGDAREFLVLPTAGWADHGVDIATPHATKEPDGLLRIANAHPGPVMYAVDEQKSGPVVVSFDNSYDIWRAMDLALVEGLWSMSELRIVGSICISKACHLDDRVGGASAGQKSGRAGLERNGVFPEGRIGHAYGSMMHPPTSG